MAMGIIAFHPAPSDHNQPVMNPFRNNLTGERQSVGFCWTRLVETNKQQP